MSSTIDESARLITCRRRRAYIGVRLGPASSIGLWMSRTAKSCAQRFAPIRSTVLPPSRGPRPGRAGILAAARSTGFDTYPERGATLSSFQRRSTENGHRHANLVGWYLLIPPVFSAIGDHPRAFNDLNASFMIAALAQARSARCASSSSNPALQKSRTGGRL